MTPVERHRWDRCRDTIGDNYSWESNNKIGDTVPDLFAVWQLAAHDTHEEGVTGTFSISLLTL